ncbi:MAG: GtrA family protein [Patescibacteria group bacterium]|nr:GtrA family protein [Patescibacteria group bacterium]
MQVIRQYLQQNKNLQQFIRFSLVGVLNTCLDFLVYTGLTRLISFFSQCYLIANFISFVCAVISSYILNKNWTFQDKSKQGNSLKFSKFILVASVGLILNELILFSLVKYVGMYDLLAKAMATILVLIWNFMASKYLVFKK